MGSEVSVMSQGGVVPTIATAGQNAPLMVRFLGKFVLEVLPAALASVIGGMLLAHYQLAHPAAGTVAVESSAPASAEMVRLVQEEHAMIRDFLLAQSAAEKSQIAAADAADASAAGDAELAAAALRRSASVLAKPVPLPPARGRASVVAATTEAAPQGPLVIAQPIEVTAAASPSPFAPPAPIAPPPPPAAADHPSLVATTLAIPGHVVGVALHAVSVIGGIPSWIGNRLGSTPS
jgi:hypothetical protein